MTDFINYLTAANPVLADDALMNGLASGGPVLAFAVLVAGCAIFATFASRML